MVLAKARGGDLIGDELGYFYKCFLMESFCFSGVKCDMGAVNTGGGEEAGDKVLWGGAGKGEGEGP